MVRLNHVPKPIQAGANKAFKTFKDKVMGLYNRVLVPLVMERELKNPNHLNQ